MSIRRHFLKIALIAFHSLLLIAGGLWAVPAVEAQAYHWNPVQIHGGGIVTGLALHPAELGLMYGRADVGGAYRWNPTNDTWTPLLDFLSYNQGSLNSIESIGLDVQDTNRLYLSCGALGGSNPSQIMRSTDRGATFTRINCPFAILGNNRDRSTGEGLGVDPHLGSTIFYGTRQDGLWKSVNYAADWAKVNSFPVNTTTKGVGIPFIEFIKISGTPGRATDDMQIVRAGLTTFNNTRIETL